MTSCCPSADGSASLSTSHYAHSKKWVATRNDGKISTSLVDGGTKAKQPVKFVHLWQGLEFVACRSSSPCGCCQTAATGGSTRIGYNHRRCARQLLTESPAASQNNTYSNHIAFLPMYFGIDWFFFPFPAANN